MYFLLKIGIFQLVMLVFRGVVSMLGPPPFTSHVKGSNPTPPQDLGDEHDHQVLGAHPPSIHYKGWLFILLLTFDGFKNPG